MANDIKSNIDININTNADEQVKQLNEMIGIIKELINTSSKLSNSDELYSGITAIVDRLSGILNDASKINKIDFSNLLDSFKQINTLFNSFNNTDNIKTEINSLYTILNKFNTYDASIFDTLSTKLKTLNDSGTILKDNDIANALNKIILETDKLNNEKIREFTYAMSGLDEALKELNKNEQELAKNEWIRPQVDALNEFMQKLNALKEQQSNIGARTSASRMEDIAKKISSGGAKNILGGFNTTSNTQNAQDAQNYEKIWEDALNNIKGKYENWDDFFKDKQRESAKQAEDSAERTKSAWDKVWDDFFAKNKTASESGGRRQSVQDFFANNLGVFGNQPFGSADDFLQEMLENEDDRRRLAEQQAYAQRIQEEAQKAQEKALLDNVGAMQRFIDTGNLSRNTLQSLATQFGATAPEIAIVTLAITSAIAAFKLYNNLLDDTVDMLKNLAKTLSSGFLGGISKIADISIAGFNAIGNGAELAVDSIQEIIDITDEAISKLQELADTGIDIQNSYYNLYTLIGTEAADSINSFTDSLASLYGLDANSIVKGMTDIVAAAGSMGVSTEQMTGAIKNMTAYAQDLSILAGSFEKAQLDIGNAISKGYVGKASVLYPLMTKNEIKQLKELSNETERYNYLMGISERVKGRYNDYLKTEAGQVAILKAQYQGLINNISTLALSLYAKIAPVLTALLRIANAVVETFIDLFNIDIKGYDNITGVTQGIADSMKNVEESTEKANKTLASFDDVIQLSDNKSDNSISSAIDPSDINIWDDLFNAEDKVAGKLDEIIKKLKELLKEGKFYDAGKLLASELNEWLKSIDWDTIIKKAGDAGKAIAEFLNGIIDFNELWITIGDTFGNAVNTVLTFLNEFAKELHWEQLGKDIVASWNSFWDTFDEKLAADALYNWFIGIFTLVKEFIQGGGITTFVDSIMSVIAGFFDNLDTFDVIDISNTIVELADQLVESLSIIVERLNNSSFEDDITTFIRNTIQGLTDNAHEWGQTFGSVLASIFELAISSLGAFLDGGGFSALGDLIINTINGFFSNLTDDDIVEAANNIIRLIDNIINTATKVIDTIVNDENIRNKLSLFIKQLISGLSEHADEWGTDINKIVTDIIGLAQDILEDADETGLSTAIYDFINALDLPGILSEWLGLKLSTWISIKLPALLAKFKPSISTILLGFIGPLLNGIGESVGGILLAQLKNIGTKISYWWNSTKEFGSNIRESITRLLNSIVTILNSCVNSIKVIFSNMWNNIKNTLNDMWNGIRNIFGNIWEFIQDTIKKIKEAISTITEPISNLKNTISNGLGSIGGLFGGTSTRASSVLEYESPKIKIPKLAKGGIVKQTTLATIGESGREAILPLQNNTDWMNDLATKIADKLNNNSSNTQNNNITIDMSTVIKPTYTRSEMLNFGQLVADALRVYGVNVSFVY